MDTAGASLQQLDNVYIARQRAYRKLGVRGLIAALLVGIFSFQFAAIVIVALAACIGSFACLAVQRRVHAIGFLVLANFAYWTATGFLSGGVNLDAVLNPMFWRGEGRAFFFYLPLLALSMIRVQRAELMFAVRTVKWLTVVGIILCGLWLLGLGDAFQTEQDPLTGETKSSLYFSGFLTSHTGAGAFWATTAAFLVAYGWRMKDLGSQVLAVAAVAVTFSTGGRAATLGLIAACCWMVVAYGCSKPKQLIFIVPVSTIAIAVSLFVAQRVPEIGERMGELASPRAIASVRAATADPTLQHAAGHFYSGVDLDHHNLVIRVYLWKYALRLAANSPLIGVGFGRFNDAYPHFAGTRGLIWMMVDGEKFHTSGIEWEQGQQMVSTGNAHNSYLHILAETGILGLALFLWLWFRIFQACRWPEAAKPNRFESAFIAGNQAMIVCLAVAALAGHALCAPTGGILMTTLIGAWIGYRRLRLPASCH